MNLPSANQIKGRWNQHVGTGRIALGELADDELLRSKGRTQKLAGLIQERSAIAHAEADKQVKAFFNTKWGLSKPPRLLFRGSRAAGAQDGTRVAREHSFGVSPRASRFL